MATITANTVTGGNTQVAAASWANAVVSDLTSLNIATTTAGDDALLAVILHLQKGS